MHGVFHRLRQSGIDEELFAVNVLETEPIKNTEIASTALVVALSNWPAPKTLPPCSSTSPTTMQSFFPKVTRKM